MQVFSQKDEDGYPTWNERAITAKDQIQKLKNGALLVRLPTKRPSIDAMREKGLNKQADALQSKVFAQNLDIVESFRSQFDFCPVYFFYSHDSKYVRELQLDSVLFLNDDLEEDESIKVVEDDYFTAEFTLLAPKQYKVKNIPDSQEKNSNYRNEAKYYGGANMRFHALIIKDEEFTQLDNPFPYYTRTLNSFFIKRKMADVVSIMNGKLYRYHSNVTQ
ncbi:MAG: hypothetical protein HKN79_05075 [Flavobacteriales bacterium]|nr:hypothetical protein [Flavobacteriales bacterium]